MTIRVCYRALGAAVYYSDLVPERNDKGETIMFRVSASKNPVLGWTEGAVYCNPSLRPAIETAILDHCGRVEIDPPDTNYKSEEQIREQLATLDAIIADGGPAWEATR